MTAPEHTDLKTMRLRYAGSCRSCSTSLPAGTVANYDRTSKQVECVDCSGLVKGALGAARAGADLLPDVLQDASSTDDGQDPNLDVVDAIDAGTRAAQLGESTNVVLLS